MKGTAQVRKLVFIGDEVEHRRWEVKKKRDQLKSLCDEFHKDIQTLLENDVCVGCENKGCYDVSSIKEKLEGSGLQLEQIEMEGRLVLYSKFVVALKGVI